MTVCIACLAAHSRAVVCVADKMLSYGYFQWDSDSGKMLTLNPSGTIVMFAGGERDISEVLGGVLAVEDKLGASKSGTRAELQRIFKEAIDHQVETLFLTPNQLTKKEYVTAISGPEINTFIKSLADKISNFKLDCGLLVCGFEDTKAFILHADNDGTVTDMTTTGFHAIGTGSDKAIARLLFSEHERAHDIERVLYDAFDAKVNAEMDPNVGYEWDATIALPATLGNHDVSEDKKELVDHAWGKYNRSPFVKFDPKKHWAVPTKWKEQLRDYIEAEIMTKLTAGKPTPP